MIRGKMVIVRGQTTYEFESSDDLNSTPDVLDCLSRAEAWVYDAPNRLAKLDEAASLSAAQPGDTIRMRTS